MPIDVRRDDAGPCELAVACEEAGHRRPRRGAPRRQLITTRILTSIRPAAMSIGRHRNHTLSASSTRFTSRSLDALVAGDERLDPDRPVQVGQRLGAVREAGATRERERTAPGLLVASRVAIVSSSVAEAGADPRSPCARRTPRTAAQSAPRAVRNRHELMRELACQPGGCRRRIRQCPVEPDGRLSESGLVGMLDFWSRRGCGCGALHDPFLGGCLGLGGRGLRRPCLGRGDGRRSGA